MKSIGSGLRILISLSRYNFARRLREEQIANERKIEEIASEIRKRSYVVVPNYLPRPACVQTLQEIDRLIESYPDCVQLDRVGSDHRIFGGENGSEFISSFHDDSFAISVGASYTRHSLKNFTTLVARLETRPGNAGSGQGWHRDSLYRQFKAIVYLTDVDSNNGPFEIIPGSHRTWNKVVDCVYANLDPDSTRLSDDQVKQLVARRSYRIDTLTGEAGTLILVDTSAVHRGKPILSGTRYALTNYYYLPEELTGRVEKFSPMLSPARANAKSERLNGQPVD